MDRNFCKLCPRGCKIDRGHARGFCGASSLPTIAKIMLHQWEEPCICYGKGSGAVFFSGCQLKCIFCQNHEISDQIVGNEFDVSDLSNLFLKLEKMGACNINLVSPTPYVNTIIPALNLAKKSGLSIPVVYNSGGYESVESLRMLDGLIDIYLPDFKFYSSELSRRYAKIEDYAERATESLEEMYRQVGNPQTIGERLIKGVIVRHLVLPACTSDSLSILDLLAKKFPKDGIILSLMRQYTPMAHASDFPELNRPITTLEYNRVVKAAESHKFAFVYIQSSQSVGENYVPDFTEFFNEKN